MHVISVCLVCVLMHYNSAGKKDESEGICTCLKIKKEFQVFITQYKVLL